MNREEHVKLFAIAAQMAERDLDGLEQRLDLDLEREGPPRADQDEQYYPQFKQSLRLEAAAMAQHYELFYILEKSIRELVREKLLAEHGATWWDNAVPEPVRVNVEKNVDRERDSGVTLRSSERIDYTTFGELGEIVRANWSSFNDTFNSEKAFTKVMTSLNLLRGPIAHCSALAPDEAVRLRLSLKDYFRLME